VPNEEKVKELLEEVTDISEQIARLDLSCKVFGKSLLRKKYGENIPDMVIAIKATPVIKQMKKDMAKYSRRIKQISQELNNGLQDMA